jgi:hypothetical protein
MDYPFLRRLCPLPLRKKDFLSSKAKANSGLEVTAEPAARMALETANHALPVIGKTFATDDSQCCGG